MDRPIRIGAWVFNPELVVARHIGADASQLLLNPYVITGLVEQLPEGVQAPAPYYTVIGEANKQLKTLCTNMARKGGLIEFGMPTEHQIGARAGASGAEAPAAGATQARPRNRNRSQANRTMAATATTAPTTKQAPARHTTAIAKGKPTATARTRTAGASA